MKRSAESSNGVRDGHFEALNLDRDRLATLSCRPPYRPVRNSAESASCPSAKARSIASATCTQNHSPADS